MSDYEVRISTLVGEVVIPFDDLDDLQTKLQKIDLKKIVEFLSEKAGASIRKETRKPKPGCEALYRFTAEGLVELIGNTGGNIHAIALALFAYDPVPANRQQLIRTSGVGNPATYMSNEAYKKYFLEDPEGFLLSQEGKEWVLNEIIPKLRATGAQPAK